LSGSTSRRRAGTRRAKGSSWLFRPLGGPGAWVPIACLLGALMITAIGGITWRTSPRYGHQARAVIKHSVGTVPVKVTKPVVVDNFVSPTRIEIPKLKASAPIIPVKTSPDGELDIPLNPKIVGWWSPGAKPGATKGTAILAGHINYAGVTGTLSAIGSLKPGDLVRVYGKHDADNKKEITFSVTGVRTYHKTALPYKQIFDQSSIGRIALVTCGGPFDASTGNYLDNVVVYAVPTSAA
jgi:hypothetical protein